MLTRVLHTSGFSVRMANGAFSCLFLNPPYADDDEKRRLEHAFLTSMTRVLPPGGVLVFIIPQRRLDISARYLSSYYTRLACFRFPDPEFERFQQIVLFGVRKPRAVADPAAEEQVRLWSAWPLAPLADDPPEPSVTVPAVPRGEVLFAPLIFDPGLAAEEARPRGVWTQAQLADQLWPPAENTVRPLMPLRRGHLALLIAAGMLNNLLVGDAESRVLIKGRTYKEFVELDSDDEDKLVEREVLRTSVAVLDLTTGQIEIVEQS